MSQMQPTLVFPGCHVRGGVERVVWETTRCLSSRYRVTVVGTTVELDGISNVNVTRVPMPGRPGFLAPARWRSAAACRLPSKEGRVVVSYGADCPVGDVLVVQSVHRAWLARGGRARVGRFTAPGWMRHLHPRHRVLLALEASYFAAAAAAGRRIVAVSRNVVGDLQRFYGIPASQTVVIPNGYSAAQCSLARSAALREEVRKDLGLAPSDVGLLLVANEWHRKGLDVLLRAVAALPESSPQVILVGRMKPSSYDALIAKLGLGSRVRYCGPSADVGRFYAAADLFVMPSQYEAFGSVIVEALASGLPVVTTACAGAAAAVQPGVNGLLQQDPLDVAELTGLLAQAVEPETRGRWRQAAPASVSEYEWSSIVRRMESVLLEAVG